MKKRIALVLSCMLVFSVPVAAEEKEEVTAEGIMQNVYDYAGIEFELNEKWTPAMELADQETVYVAMFIGDEGDMKTPILTLYVGKHDHDTEGTYDNMIGFFSKTAREEGTDIYSDDWDVLDYAGKVYYYYGKDGDLISAFSVDLPDSVVEFIVNYDSSYATKENLKIVADNVTGFAVSLMMPFLNAEKENE